MTDQYRRVVGDTESPIEDQLTNDGTNTDISGFQSVEIHIEKPDGTVITADDTGNVTVGNSPEGLVKYDFQAGDLDQQGRYFYEWQVTFGDGGILTFPGDGRATIWAREETG
jgi:hypothetical protein